MIALVALTVSALKIAEAAAKNELNFEQVQVIRDILTIMKIVDEVQLSWTTRAKIKANMEMYLEELVPIEVEKRK